ncbi:cobyric acid synthase [Mycobacterium shigaense]|uniref:Cobyric acid synthase n=1 Tax=Mycobacterium shigaense TaxID=722731 RepID=A0A1Z4EFW1_9MYCO|nr:cobyric acid synthase [Mycobacterium shigaense]MEA1125013.1 cobyric acid synthase [Mycobacterium shigaense]PRI14079.1 cobyric acid synthase CobQ [Mycobacterium shigaense]BAX91861.1 cobyric acid synthase [Mycobacterium shigaense]
MSGALLVAGTSSDAGKSVVVAGLCRLLARTGIRVAPFKAQNMSNNSVVTVDGGEIGRAQALQARAAGLAPSVRFNPILLKPGSDRTSQLVIRGQVADSVSAADYVQHRDVLAKVVIEELSCLRDEFDAVICEGAGSAAEINLRATDLANMGLARAGNLPVILVGDIDRGGLLAHLFGTVAVLEAADQALIAGFIVNKFRGDPALLEPGLRQLLDMTGRPTYGVLPYAEELWLDAEDSLSVLAHRVVGTPEPPRGDEWLRVAAVRLPRISNSTDVEALACEPGVLVRWVTDPADVADADLIVLPGSKATVADLAWLRERGLAAAIAGHAASGGPVLGICGGMQMLCRNITDTVESRRGEVAGLGLLDADIAFGDVKTLRSWQRPLTGYEIHYGRLTRCGAASWFDVEAQPHGIHRGAVYGTHWHGLLDNDDFRRAWLTRVADAAGRTGFVVAADTDVAGRRDAQLDRVADLLAAHLDTDAVLGLLDGPPPQRPHVASRLRSG